MALSTILYSVSTNLYRFGGPFLMIIGGVSSILNLIVFSQNTLRKNPCSICFLALNINYLLYLSFDLSIGTLAVGYDFNPTANNIVICRCAYYMGYVFICLSPSYVVVAAIDRIFITSSNAGTRKRSTRRFVLVCIISLTLFWILFHIHALIYIQILQLGPNYFVCFYQPGTYTIFMTYFSLIVNGMIPPLLMAFLGFWTIKNIRQMGRAVHPAIPMVQNTRPLGRSHNVQSKDRQFIRMLVMDITVYIISLSSSTIFLIYQQITQYRIKSIEQDIIEEYVQSITYFLVYIAASVSCYTNLLVSKTFRTELKRALSKIRPFYFLRPHQF